MKKILLIILLTVLFVSFIIPCFSAVMVRVKDIAYIEGLKENQVYGFGLVVGLQGTGDSKSHLIQSSLSNLLKNLGFAEEESIKSKNIAAVLLTAKLPPFVSVGDRIDITVSSIGDAKSLAGGILIQSSLRGSDSINYIAAQGPVSIRPSAKGGRSVKTVASITNGGIVEREVAPNIVRNNSINLILKKWDFSVAKRLIESISGLYSASKPTLGKGGRINITLPKKTELIKFVSDIENLEIEPSYQAKIVINESDGTIVMGKNVKISEAVVSKEGLTVKIDGGSKGTFASIKEASTVNDLVESLNYVGASTRDIISILNALKEADALHAKLIIK